MRVVLFRPRGYRSWYYEHGVQFEATETTSYVRVRLAGNMAIVNSFWVSNDTLYIGLVGLEYDEDGTPVYVVPVLTDTGVIVLKTTAGATLFADGRCVEEKKDIFACESYSYAILCDSDNVCVPLAGISPIVFLTVAGILGGTLVLYKYYESEREKARARIVEGLEKLYGKLEEYCKLNPYDCVKAHQALTSLLTQFRAELEEDPFAWLRQHWKELLAIMVSIASILLLIIKFNVIRAILDVIRGRRR